MNYLAGKSKKRSQPLLGGSSHDLQVVSNYHGDRKSRRPGVVGPLPNGLFMAYKMGLRTTYIPTGVILQVILHGYLQNPSFWRRILSPIIMEGEKGYHVVRRKNSSSRAYKTSMVMDSLSVAFDSW